MGFLYLWETKEKEYLTKKEVRKIVIELNKLLKNNKDLEKTMIKKHNVCFIHKDSNSLDEEFSFRSEFDNDEKIILAETIAGVRPYAFIVTLMGTLELNSVRTQNEEYAVIIEEAMNILVKYSNNKIIYKKYLN